MVVGSCCEVVTLLEQAAHDVAGLVMEVERLPRHLQACVRDVGPWVILQRQHQLDVLVQLRDVRVVVGGIRQLLEC